jgi:N-acetylneuraminic acid mutarotase
MEDQAQKWAELRILDKKKPMRRSHHSAVLFGERMYVFGGRGAWDEKLNDVWMYVFEHETWEHGEPTNPPAARSHHTASIHGDLMYVFGGQRADCSCLDEFIVLEMNEMRWTTPRTKHRGDDTVPLARDSHSASCLDTAQLLVIGGVDDGGNALIDVHSWDLTEGGWTPMKMSGEAPPARYGHASVAASPVETLVFGGVNVTGEKLNDLWALKASTATWTKIQSVGMTPRPRFCHSACVHGSVMVVFGGTLAGAEATNDLFYLGIGSIGSGCLEWRERQGDALRDNNDDDTTAQESTNSIALINYSIKSHKAQRPDVRQARPRVQPCQRVVTEDESAVLKMIFGIDTGKGSNAVAPLERLEGRVPCARDGHSAVVYDGMVFIFGGERNHMKFDDLFVYKV